MATCFGCCCVDDKGSPQSPNFLRSCKVQEKMVEGEMGVTEAW